MSFYNASDDFIRLIPLVLVFTKKSYVRRLSENQSPKGYWSCLKLFTKHRKNAFQNLDLIFTLYWSMFPKLEEGIKTAEKCEKDFSVNFQIVKKF